MTEKYLNEQYQYICSLLEEKRLKEALDILEAMFINPSYYEKINSIRMPHNYMLKYMLEGMEDPQRRRLHTKLILDTLELTDDCFNQEMDQISQNIYHKYRKEKLPYLNNLSFSDINKTLSAFTDELAVNMLYNDKEKIDNCIRRHEEGMNNLFMKSWLSNRWTKADEEEATQLIHSTTIIPADLALMVSAVTLSLTISFDIRRFNWLIDTYKNEHLTVSQRALVGIVIVAVVQQQRMKHYPEIIARLSFLFDDVQTKKNIQNIYLQLLQSQETEKIDKKMREEILPEMMKNASQLKGLKFGFEEGEEGNELNPEWSDAMENSALNDKIKEISELQMQGADVYMSSFASLKGYPFFNEIQNWFYPFEKRHSSVYNEFGIDDKKGSVIDLILNSTLFCNSDKYSFCFTFQHIPKEQREMGLSQLSEEQMGGLEAEQKAMRLKELALDPSHISNQYIHDLYRFYKLYRNRYDFKNIFSLTLNIYQISLFKPVLEDAEFLLKLAEFFLKNEHYERAIEIYVLLEAMEKQTAETLQKCGFCYQKLKQYQMAIEYFIKADTLKPDTVWTNRHLATCYRNVLQFEKALYYYQEVEKVQPKNMTILFYIGMCYTALKQYNEALQYFFKMDFIKEGDKRASRAIAWTSFLIGNLEQAKKYYDTITAKSNLPIDFLNAGHIAWALKDIKSAVDNYRRAIELNNDKSEIVQLIIKDKPQLIKQGVSEDDFPLMIDLIDE